MDINNTDEKGLIAVTKRVRQTQQTAFVFGACVEFFLLDAPGYAVPVLLMPGHDVYTRRWRTRKKNDARRIEFAEIPLFGPNEAHFTATPKCSFLRVKSFAHQRNRHNLTKNAGNTRSV